MGRGDDAYRSLSLGPDVSEEVNRIDSIEAREFFKSSQNTFLQEEKMEVCQRTQITRVVMFALFVNLAMHSDHIRSLFISLPRLIILLYNILILVLFVLSIGC